MWAELLVEIAGALFGALLDGLAEIIGWRGCLALFAAALLLAAALWLALR